MPRPFVRSVVALLLVVSGAVAARPPLGDPHNAATWYLEAIDALQVLTDEDRIYVADVLERHLPPTPRLREILARAAPALRAAERGAQEARADFNLQYEQGFELLLPHLSQLRMMARLMAVDANVRLHDGNTSGAAARLTSMYQMGRHVTSDRILISSLVGQSIFSVSDANVQFGLDQAAFTPNDLALIRDGLADFSGHDPFGFVEGVIMEQELFLHYVGEHAADEGFMQNIGGALGEDDPTLANLSPEQIQDMLGRTDRLIDQVVETFQMDDRDAARARLADLMREVEAGEHGHLAMLLIPAYTRILDNMYKGEDQLAARLAQLDRVVEGRSTILAESNGAFFYARAIELLHAHDADDLAAALAGRPAPGAVDAEAERQLNALGDVFDLFVQAAAIPRCRFDSLRTGDDPTTIHDYQAGLYEGGRLALADAARWIARENSAAAADRLALVLRIAAALATDEPLLSAAISHDLAMRVPDLVDAVVARPGLSPAEERLLLDAGELFPRADPFGFIASGRYEREQLERAIGRCLDWAGDGSRQWTYYTTLLRDYSNRKLLYLRAAMSTLDPPGPGAARRPEWLDPLVPADLRARLVADAPGLDEKMKIQAAAYLAAVDAWFAVARPDDADTPGPPEPQPVDFLDGVDVPDIGRASERGGGARRDLRQLLGRLRVTDAASDEPDDPSMRPD